MPKKQIRRFPPKKFYLKGETDKIAVGRTGVSRDIASRQDSLYG
ncbi:hypothetical protein [Limibacterium fermenti]|jgi:hypothetical protein